MTNEELRDHFAGLALAGMLTQTEDVEYDSGYHLCPIFDARSGDAISITAKLAYAIADAMLKARGH